MAKREGVVICRCEDVRDVDLDAHLRSRAAASLEGLKRYTRVMMGPCQGRVCRTWLLHYWQQAVARELAPSSPLHSLNSTADLVLPGPSSVPGYRPPVRLVRVGEIAALEIAENAPWGDKEAP